MKKLSKIFVLAMAFVLIIASLQMSVLAGGEMENSYIMINGDGVKRPLLEESSGDGWIYDGNGVLTLNGYDGGEIYLFSNYDDRINFTIILINDNYVKGSIISGDHSGRDYVGYGCIDFSGDGTLAVDYLGENEYRFYSNSVTANSSLSGCDIFIYPGAVLNVNEDNSGGTLSSNRITVDGGVLNIHNNQQSFWLGESGFQGNYSRITNGGIINVSSNDDFGALLSGYEADILNNYCVTDFQGGECFQPPMGPDDPSESIYSVANPDVPLKNVRISDTALYYSIKGCRVDEWAKAIVDEADAVGLVPASLDGEDLRTNISRADFAAVAVCLYESMSGEKAEASSGNPFTDTEDENILKAYSLGITNGTSDTTFSPQDDLTREQASTMLLRVYEKLGGEITKTDAGFSDDSEISDWAKDAVNFMSDNNILQGVGDNMFSPKSNAQKQQAIVIALRMYNNLK